MSLFSGLGSIVGGLLGLGASDKAAKTQEKSSEAAIAEQRRQYDTTRNDQMPWLQAGQNALAKLQDPNAFTASSGYAFRRSEGDRGIQQNAAARGGAFSGNALKALTEYNSNLASQEYGNWFNQQAGIAGVGQTSANALGAYGQNSAGNIGNALMSGGDARASGIIGGANSLSQGLSGAADIYDYFKKPKVGSGVWV